MIYWLSLAGAILVSVAGQVLLKTGAAAASLLAQATDPHSLAGLFCYIVASPLYLYALRRIPISIAMPFTAISYVLSAAIGHWWFQETLGAAQISGIALIVIGAAAMASGLRSGGD